MDPRFHHIPSYAEMGDLEGAQGPYSRAQKTRQHKAGGRRTTMECPAAIQTVAPLKILALEEGGGLWKGNPAHPIEGFNLDPAFVGIRLLSLVSCMDAVQGAAEPRSDMPSLTSRRTNRDSILHFFALNSSCPGSHNATILGKSAQWLLFGPIIIDGKMNLINIICTLMWHQYLHIFLVENQDPATIHLRVYFDK